MNDLYLLSEDQLKHISAYFPLSYGVAHVDVRGVISCIIYVIKHGLR